MTSPQIILHATEFSGHSHRVELLLRMLGLAYRIEPAPAEVRRSEAFRRLNPFGQVPVLQDGDLVLADSNAILVYLVKRYAPQSQWLPEEPVTAAFVQRWLSIAAGEIKYGPGTARLIAQWNAPGDAAWCAKIAEGLLNFMDGHLADRDWLATDRATIADLACYSYVAHAPEGGVSLEPYAAVRAWLRRVEALPRFKAMQPLPGSQVA
jgi:glutathione S-transferase